MARNRYHDAGRAGRVLWAPFGLLVGALRGFRPGAVPLLAAALLAGLGYAGWRAVIHSPYFLVRVVDVEPTAHLDRERIVGLVGLDRPTSILEFDEVAATEALRAERWVAVARVNKTLPEQVDITIEERTAAGVVVLEELFLVGDDGHPFVKPSAGEAHGLPLITGLSRADWSADPDAAASRIRAALALARRYERLPIARKRPLSDVRLAPGGRMELMLGQMRVALGSTDFEEKLMRLVLIDRQLSKKNMDASYVLLSDDLARAIVKETPLAAQASNRRDGRLKGKVD